MNLVVNILEMTFLINLYNVYKNPEFEFNWSYFLPIIFKLFNKKRLTLEEIKKLVDSNSLKVLVSTNIVLTKDGYYWLNPKITEEVIENLKYKLNNQFCTKAFSFCGMPIEPRGFFTVPLDKIPFEKADLLDFNQEELYEKLFLTGNVFSDMFFVLDGKYKNNSFYIANNSLNLVDNYIPHTKPYDILF